MEDASMVPSIQLRGLSSAGNHGRGEEWVRSVLCRVLLGFVKSSQVLALHVLSASKFL